MMNTIDWTGVLVALIGAAGTLLSGVLAYACKRYIAPWLAQRGLAEAAAIVVGAVEAILGRGFGDEGKGRDKWNLALAKMAERGFDIDSHAVLDALEAAWIQLDLTQITAGAKDGAE